jgi:hypothetical protein
MDKKTNIDNDRTEISKSFEEKRKKIKGKKVYFHRKYFRKSNTVTFAMDQIVGGRHSFLQFISELCPEGQEGRTPSSPPSDCCGE